MAAQIRGLITLLFVILLTACGSQPAPTPTVPPTNTPVPTATNTPQPTDTPVPTSTNTPLPTDTPVPPTATPVPPTNTPEPPTATPLPTDTPLPTNTPLPTDTPTVTPQPTDTPLPPTAVPKYKSGGLGMPRSQWNEGHETSALDFSPMGTGYDGKYDVSFSNNNVWLINRQYGSSGAVTAADVKAEAGRLIPTDSQIVQTYSPKGRPETTVMLYFSQSLVDRFTDLDWIGGEAGNFTVQYNQTQGVGVTSMTITTGNNP